MRNVILYALLFLCVFHQSCIDSDRTKNTKIITDSEDTKTNNLKITTLSTMLANRGIGEWGYSALVEVDGKKILFDTGRRPETVLQNAQDLQIDLSTVEDVILSHNHGDHTGGLLTLRNKLKQKNPNALKRVHVGKGIFSERMNGNNRMNDLKTTLEADGVTFIIHDANDEILPGIWVTGPVKRVYDERNWGGNGRIVTSECEIEDTIPEDQSLVIKTDKGIILLSGCGHAGIINTLEHIRTHIGNEKIYATIGGFHLVNASDKHLEWTASKMSEFGVSKIIGAHCTGINSLYALRELLQLGRENAVVGSVGDSFDLVNGINAGVIAR